MKPAGLFAMFPCVTAVHHVQAYELQITFSDGTVACIDFRDRVVGRGGIFQPLQSVDYFAQAAVDREAGTVVWPNGVDFCPDVLYAEATRKEISQLSRELEIV